jgi:hypothetical protein
MSEWVNVSNQDINIEQYVGFVYKIIERDTGMAYVGIKKFKKQIRRKPLKGQKRVRICHVESDWKTYVSSSRHIKEKIKENPDNYARVIIFLAETVTQMKAYEAWYQLDKYMKGDWDNIYNEMINLRLRIPKSKK